MIKPRTFAAAFLFGMLLTAAGCGAFTGATKPSETPIMSFSLSPLSGPAGTVTTLTWTATPSDTRIAITATAGPNLGTAFPTSGSTTAAPAVTTSYTVTGTDPDTGVQAFITQTFTVK